MTSTGSATSKSDGFNYSPGSVGDQQDHRPQMDMSTSGTVSIIMFASAIYFTYIENYEWTNLYLVLSIFHFREVGCRSFLSLLQQVQWPTGLASLIRNKVPVSSREILHYQRKKYSHSKMVLQPRMT